MRISRTSLGTLTLSAAVVAASSGVAQAAVITETFTGVIYAAAYDNGFYNTHAAPDVNDLFGGGNLLGDTVTVSFSYNTSLLAENGSYSSNSIDEYYQDRTSDSAITESVTIGTTTYGPPC